MEYLRRRRFTFLSLIFLFSVRYVSDDVKNLLSDDSFLFVRLISSYIRFVLQVPFSLTLKRNELHYESPVQGP